MKQILGHFDADLDVGQFIEIFPFHLKDLD